MKVIVALNLPKPATKLIAFARHVVSSMTGNAHFPVPTPALSEVEAAIAGADATQARTLTRTKGTREARNVELAALRLLLTHLAAYVQSVADADPQNAAAIILSAGMYLKARSIRSKPPFDVVQGDLSGSAKLSTKSAGDRALYAWLCGTDPKQLVVVRNTIQTSTIIDGLTPGVTHYFQVHVTTKDGLSWVSVVLALLIK